MAFDLLGRHRRAVAGGTAALAILVVSWLATRHTDADPVLRDEALTGIVRSVAVDAGISTCEVELASGACASRAGRRRPAPASRSRSARCITGAAPSPTSRRARLPACSLTARRPGGGE